MTTRDTFDPRLDVVIEIMRQNLSRQERAQRILNVLDAMRPDALDDEYQAGWLVGHRTARDEADAQGTPNPAGLSAAQGIRLRIVEMLDHIDAGEDLTNVIAVSGILAAWVEHGPDETPSLRVRRDELQRWKDAEARANLAEARLGHIADAVEDYEAEPGPDTAPAFRRAVAECLAWTPDDTAAPDFVSGTDPITRLTGGGIRSTDIRPEFVDDTAPAGADEVKP